MCAAGPTGSCARVRASTLSVLIFASAIARVLARLHAITRPTSDVSRFAIASLFPVASQRHLIIAT